MGTTLVAADMRCNDTFTTDVRNLGVHLENIFGSTLVCRRTIRQIDNMFVIHRESRAPFEEDLKGARKLQRVTRDEVQSSWEDATGIHMTICSCSRRTSNPVGVANIGGG
jgi:hypothetical protein